MKICLIGTGHAIFMDNAARKNTGSHSINELDNISDNYYHYCEG